MMTKRFIIVLTYLDGVLFRSKKFIPDLRYTDNFIDNKLADEIVVIDISKSKKNRKLFYNALDKISNKCFIPITVGGHIDSLSEIKKVQMLGADKILINSIIHSNEKLVERISDMYGRQFIVGGIDVKLVKKKYKLFSYQGSKMLNINIDKCIKKFEKCKIGEILVQSIDKDGSLRGFDLMICKLIKKKTNLPVIACGGAGNAQHFIDVFKFAKVDGACSNNIYHFSEKSITSIKKNLIDNKIYIKGYEY